MKGLYIATIQALYTKLPEGYCNIKLIFQPSLIVTIINTHVCFRVQHLRTTLLIHGHHFLITVLC